MEQIDAQTNNIEDEVLAERLAMMIDGKAPDESEQDILDEIERRKKEKDEQWQIITMADIQSREIEDRPIIKGLLYEEEPTVIHSEGGTGKSIITQDISMATACGLSSLWDMFPIAEPRAAIFIQSENTLGSINQRVRKKCKGNPDYLIGLSNIAFPYLHENIMAAGYMEDKNFRQQIIDFAKRVENQTAVKVGLLVFDPLISFHHEQENENVAMRKTLDHIQNDIALRIGATPIIIHHDNRQGEFRGASAIRDWARNMIKLQGYLHKGQKRIKLIHEKCNNHEMFETFTLKMDEYLNFTPLEEFELIPAKKRNKCQQIREALEMMGGKAETKGQLAEQYKEISGCSKQTCFNHIDAAVEHDFIKCEAYEKGSIHQHRYFIMDEGV
jgi:hypothetical protein